MVFFLDAVSVNTHWLLSGHLPLNWECSNEWQVDKDFGLNHTHLEARLLGFGTVQSGINIQTFRGRMFFCLQGIIVRLCMTTLTEVFPCSFLSCKANARVKPAKMGHGPHSSQIVVLFYVFLCCSMYCLFCDVLCIVCVYMCTEQLPPGGYPIAVNPQVTNVIYIWSTHS